MKVLITGAVGFIGFHLSRALLDKGYEVIGLDNINNYYNPKLKISRKKILIKNNNFTFEKIDITNREGLNTLFKNYQPKKVVNLAAQAGVRYSITNPYAYLDSNLIGNIGFKILKLFQLR